MLSVCSRHCKLVSVLTSPGAGSLAVVGGNLERVELSSTDFCLACSFQPTHILPSIFLHPTYAFHLSMRSAPLSLDFSTLPSSGSPSLVQTARVFDRPGTSPHSPTSPTPTPTPFEQRPTDAIVPFLAHPQLLLAAVSLSSANGYEEIWHPLPRTGLSSRRPIRRS